jgi:hypothetical protein
MTVFAQNGSAGFRLERHVIVSAAVVADDFKTARRVVSRRRFFRAALRASLRRGHIALVKIRLLFFGENEYVFALHARDFDVGHRSLLLLFLDCAQV